MDVGFAAPGRANLPGRVVRPQALFDQPVVEGHQHGAHPALRVRVSPATQGALDVLTGRRPGIKGPGVLTVTPERAAILAGRAIRGQAPERAHIGHVLIDGCREFEWLLLARMGCGVRNAGSSQGAGSFAPREQGSEVAWVQGLPEAKPPDRPHRPL